jgi:hypothetical protein
LLCGCSVEPLDSPTPKHQHYLNRYIQGTQTRVNICSFFHSFFFFIGVMAEDGQWLPYHLLVMEQRQAVQMSR